MTERLFFALWPSDELRQQLAQVSQQVAQTISGKAVKLNNLHMTLAFLGNIESPTKRCMQQAAETLQEKSFQLNLSTLGYWTKPHILYLGIGQMPSELFALVNNLTTALMTCGYQPERRAYQAHMTVMRKVSLVKQPLPEISPLIWTVNNFCLVRSDMHATGVHYEVIDQWHLV